MHRREAKDKGEKKRYTHWNVKFLSITRQDKKAFLRDQCKERKTIEWERQESSSRKLEIPRERFHAKMGSLKDRNGMDITEAEDIKKRWQEYTEELYKKDVHNPDNHERCESVAINRPTHLENSAVATGLEKVRFHANPKERQCQRMLKLQRNCTHLTR